MYTAEDVLLARSFDLDSLELSSAPVPVVTGVQRAVRSELDSASDLRWRQATGFASYGFSDTGTLVYVEEEEVPRNRVLALVDRKGGVERLDVPPGSRT